VHDADQGDQLQPGDQREQVGMGVEGGPVEVLARGGDHPQALLAQPLVLGQVRFRKSSSAGAEPASASKTVAARASSCSGAPLTKQRITSLPDAAVILWNVAISL